MKVSSICKSIRVNLIPIFFTKTFLNPFAFSQSLCTNDNYLLAGWYFLHTIASNKKINFITFGTMFDCVPDKILKSTSIANQSMKNKLLFAIFLVAAISVKAQTSNAILFTENGEKFQVILNGILQNAKPETNVKMTGLPAPNYKCRIIFEDKTLGYVDFNMFFPEMGTEATWNIKKNKKGEYVTRGVSAVPLAQAPPPPPTQTVVVYTTTPAVETTSTTVSQTTTTTTSGGTNPTGTEMNMGINMNENGGGISVAVIGMEGTGTSSTTTTTSHSTTVSSSSTSSSPNYDHQPAPDHVVYVDGYSGNIGCPVPMSKGDFQSFKSSVESKSFEDSKLTIAKQVLNNNCLTSSQVREVMKLFSFEETRLDFAKYAYGHTYDINNYYKVNDAFTFESSIDDLNTYINAH
jgi:hypothetical protein